MKKTLFIIALVWMGPVSAQLDTVTVRELSTAWISHDLRGEAFQVYDAQDVSVGGFYLAEDEIREGLVQICGDPFDFWVEGRLLHHQGRGCEYFGVEEIFGDLMLDTVYCAIMSPVLSEVQVELQRVQPSVARIYELPSSRVVRVEDNVWWLLMLTVLVLLSILRIADDQTYSAMTRLAFIQRRVGYDEDAMFSLSNLLMMMIVGLLLGFHIVVFRVDSSSLGMMLSALGAATLMFYGFLLAKALILQVAGSLFKYHRVRTLHFRAYLLFMTIFMLLLYLMQLAGQWFQIEGTIYWQVIRYAGPFISAVFVFWIYFQLSSEVPKRKLHIISYLCTTEILPTFILANWLLN